MSSLRYLACLALLGACSAPVAEPTPPAVPPALAPAFALLDSALSPADRETLRRVPRDSLFLYHFTLGMWLRNEGGLWRGGPVAESLLARGVEHPDDMSHLILDAYGLYLRGQSVDLEALVAEIPPPPMEFMELPPSSGGLDSVHPSAASHRAP